MANVFAQQSPADVYQRGLGIRPKTNPLANLKAASARHNVPANVLMALAEADGDTDLANVETNARDLSAVLKGGGDLKDALEIKTGDAAKAKALGQRANAILDAARPEQAGPTDAKDEKPTGIGRFLSDQSRIASGSTTKVIGGAVHALGTAADAVGSAIYGAEDEGAAGTSVGRGVRSLGDFIKDRGQATMDRRSEQSRNARFIDGDADFTKPSTWALDENASIEGAINMLAEGLGSMAPTVLAGLFSGGAGVAAGFASSGGAAAQDAEDTIDAMAADVGGDGISRLEKESPIYRQFIADGKSAAEAVEFTKQEMRGAVTMAAGAVGGAGGGFTSHITRKPLASLAGKGVAGRVAGTAAISGAEEGSQEVGETVAQRAAMNATIGTNEDLTKGTLNDFIGGAMAGGAVGAVSGASHGSPEQPDAFGRETSVSPEIPPSEDPLSIRGPMDPARGLPAPPRAPPAPPRGIDGPDTPALLESEARPLPPPPERSAADTPDVVVTPPPAPRDEPLGIRPPERPLMIEGPRESAPAETAPDVIAPPAPPVAPHPGFEKPYIGAGNPAPETPDAGSGSTPIGSAAPSPVSQQAGAAPIMSADSQLGIRPIPPATPKPIGPLTSALAALSPTALPKPPSPVAAPKFPDQKPGAAIRLAGTDGIVADAVFLGETPDGRATVRADGETHTLSPVDFDRARSEAVRVDEAAKVGAKAGLKTPSAPAELPDPSSAPEGETNAQASVTLRAHADDTGSSARTAPSEGADGKGVARAEEVAEQPADSQTRRNIGAGSPASVDYSGAEQGNPGVADAGNVDSAVGRETPIAESADEGENGSNEGVKAPSFDEDAEGAIAALPDEQFASLGKVLGFRPRRDGNKAKRIQQIMALPRETQKVAFSSVAKKDEGPAVSSSDTQQAVYAPEQNTPRPAERPPANAVPPVKSGQGFLKTLNNTKGTKAKARVRDAGTADYLAPGNVVQSYGGHDIVLGYDPADRKIRVQAAVQKDGVWSPDPAQPPRVHGTLPDDRQLANGPVYRAPLTEGHGNVQKMHVSKPEGDFGAQPSQDLSQPNADVLQRPIGSVKDKADAFGVNIGAAAPVDADGRATDNQATAQAWLNEPAKAQDKRQSRGAELPAPDPIGQHPSLQELDRAGMQPAKEPDTRVLHGEGRRWTVRAANDQFVAVRHTDQEGTARIPPKDLGTFGNPLDAMDAIRADGGIFPAPGDQKPAQNQIARIPVKHGKAITARGREVGVEYALAELNDLTPSQLDDGRDNPAFPQELQPRARSGNRSQEQIRKIAAELKPELLGESPQAGAGAPIISSDGVVESGNGRTLALRRAYDEGTADGYRAWLKQQGYPEGDFKRPALVRIRTDEMSIPDRAAFAREANERDTASMSANEQQNGLFATRNDGDGKDDGSPLAAGGRSAGAKESAKAGRDDPQEGEGRQRAELTQGGVASPEKVTKTNGREQRESQPVSELAGDELGQWDDIRQLGRKAADWYRENLVGKTVVMSSTGWPVQFGRVGAKKIGGRKGDVLLRAVPALEQIIENARLISTRAGSKPGTERQTFHKVAARVKISGQKYDVIATLREDANGTFHYDLSMDQGAKEGEAADRVAEARSDLTPRLGDDDGVKGFSSPTVLDQASTSALEGGPAEFNLVLDDTPVNAPDPSITPERARLINMAALSELAHVGLLDKIGLRVEAGRLTGAGGTYSRGVISILRDRGRGWRHTLDHEIIHALRDPERWGGSHGLFAAEEWRALVRAARADNALMEAVKRVYPDLDTAGQMEEAVAELYADWAQGRRDVDAGPLRAALETIRSFFRAVASALRGEGFVDAARVMERIEMGEIGERGGDGSGTIQPRGPDGRFVSGQRSSPARIKTEAFRRWFADSKVVDANGEPLVVYHGTRGEAFEAFDPEKLGSATGAGSAKQGFFFAGNPIVASGYAAGTNAYKESPAARLTDRLTFGMHSRATEALLGALGLPSGIKPDGTVLPVYLSIKNPLIHDFKGSSYREQTYGKLLARARKAGNDGVILRNTFDPGFREDSESGRTELTDIYVTFEPEQIKSAFNGGSFNPDDPRIMEQRTDGDVPSFADDMARVAAQIGDVLANKTITTPIALTQSPPVFRALWGKDVPVVIAPKVIWKANADKHGLTGRQITEALKGLADPVMVFDSLTTADSLVALVDVPGEGRAVVVALHANEAVGRIEVSRVASIHAKDNSDAIPRWMRQGLLRYFNREKAGGWSRSRGLQLPKDGTTNRRDLKILQHRDVFKGDEPANTLDQRDTGAPEFLSIADVIAAAKRPGHAPEKAETGTAADWVVRAAAEAGIDMSGLRHVIDGSAVRHIFKQHGENGVEARRGQVAVSDADLEKIGDVIGDADAVAFGTKTGIGRDAVIYARNMPDGTISIVEELRSGKREAAVVTMWKRSAAKDPDALRRILLSYARSDGGTPAKVFMKDEAVKEQRDIDAIREALTARARKAGQAFGSRGWRRGSELWSDFLTDAMGRSTTWNLLSLVPGRPLFKELGRNLLSAQAYVAHKDEMDAQRGDWHERAADTAKAWMKLRRRDNATNSVFMDLLHETTIAQVDPTKPFEPHRVNKDDPASIAREAKRRADHARLSARFNALPAPFKDLWGRVRKDYDAIGDAFEAAILKNIEAAAEIAGRRAAREHAKSLREIEDDGLTGAEREAAIAEADEKLAKIRNAARVNGRARIAQLRKAFEANRLAGPYVPLARYGNFFVTVRDDAGKVVSFSMFETAAVQRSFIAEAEKDAPGRVQHGVMSQSTDLKQQVDPGFVADVERILAETGASDAVMDAIWQRWLETLPDQSIRTSKIHRKGRAGYGRDALRAYGDHLFHGAHQLAKLEWGLRLEDDLEEAVEEAKRQPDPNRAAAVVNEMRQRHAFTMNPDGSPLVAAASGMAFTLQLAASPAAALVNITQTTVVGIPMLAARFQKAGVLGTASALSQAARDFTRAKGYLEKSNVLNPDEQAALAEGLRRGVIDKTQAHSLAEIAEHGVSHSPARDQVQRALSFFFHHAERFNREVTFVAAYRLGRGEGMAHDAAIEAATDATWASHFDTQNNARPRFMQSDMGKILTTFRSFQVNMLWRMFRDLHQAFNGASPELRREARLQAAGITLSMFAHAGIRGVWGYALLTTLLSAFLPGDDDDLDAWLQDALLFEGDNLPTAAWNFAMGAVLNGAPGQMTGISLTNRIGMPELWFREVRDGLTAQETGWQYVKDALGPTIGWLAGSIPQGLSEIAEGEYWRGTERIIPKFGRDPMKAARYAWEGVQAKDGDIILESVNPYQVLIQAAGFTPASVAQRYDQAKLLRKGQAEISDRRSRLQKLATDAVKAKEPIPAKVLDQIRAFNREVPEWPITAETIRASYRSRERAAGRAQIGVNVNPRLSERLSKSLPQPVPTL